MPPVAMQISLKGSEITRQHLEEARLRATNLGPALTEIGEYMVSATQRTFEAGGRPNKWKPSKRALAEGGKTLIDTGRLRASIFRRVNPSAGVVRWGTNVVYGKAHQLGVRATARQSVRAHTRKSRKGRAFRVRAHTRTVNLRIPKRPFLNFLLSDRREVRRILARRLGKAGKP